MISGRALRDGNKNFVACIAHWKTTDMARSISENRIVSLDPASESRLNITAHHDYCIFLIGIVLGIGEFPGPQRRVACKPSWYDKTGIFVHGYGRELWIVLVWGAREDLWLIRIRKTCRLFACRHTTVCQQKPKSHKMSKHCCPFGFHICLFVCVQLIKYTFKHQIYY